MNRARILIVPVALLAALIAQCVFAVKLTIGPARPDFILVAVVCLALYVEGSESKGIWIGFFGGLLSSSASSAGAGSILTSLIAAGWLAAWISGFMSRDNPLTPLAATVASNIVARLIVFAMAPSDFSWLLKTSAGQILWDLAIAIVLYFILRWAYKERTAADPFERRLRRDMLRSKRRSKRLSRVSNR